MGAAGGAQKSLGSCSKTVLIDAPRLQIIHRRPFCKLRKTMGSISQGISARNATTRPEPVANLIGDESNRLLSYFRYCQGADPLLAISPRR
jgi:hypothetical protein